MTQEQTYTHDDVSICSRRYVNNIGVWQKWNEAAGSISLNFDRLPEGASIQSVVFTATLGSSYQRGKFVFNNKVIALTEKTIAETLNCHKQQTIDISYTMDGIDNTYGGMAYVYITNISVKVLYDADQETPVESQSDILPGIVKMVTFNDNGTVTRSLQTVKYLHPIKLSATLKSEPGSTADMTVLDDDLPIDINSLVYIKTPHAYHLFYVKQIRTDYKKGRQTVLKLDDVWNLLDQIIIPDKIANSVMSGSTQSPTVTQCLDWVLNKQEWNTDNFLSPPAKILIGLRNVDATMANIRNDWAFEGQSIKAVIDSVFACLPNYNIVFSWQGIKGGCWAFDIVKQPTQVGAELRLSRNVQSLQVNYDMADMYNTVFPTGKNKMTLKNMDDGSSGVTTWSDPSGSSNMVYHVHESKILECSASVQTWGRRMKSISESTKTKTAELADWAANELFNHCQPSMSITCDAMELSVVSGAAFDSLSVGKIVRIPLPQYGTVLTEKIVSATYSDLIHNPQSVTLTIGKERRTIESVSNKRESRVKRITDDIGFTLRDLTTN